MKSLKVLVFAAGVVLLNVTIGADAYAAAPGPVLACVRLKQAIIRLSDIITRANTYRQQAARSMTGRQREIFLRNSANLTKTHRRERIVKRARFYRAMAEGGRECRQFCYSEDDPDAPYRIYTGKGWISPRYLCNSGWDPSNPNELIMP